MRDTAAPAAIAPALLAWYDQHARALPWRVPPQSRDRPDPYRVWLSEVMLQQTTVAAAGGYFQRFMTRWPDIRALAAAEDSAVMAEWAGLGYYARARNLLKCARIVAARGGFPRNRTALQELPGIGPYTAAAIAAIAFDHPETVVDGNVERVMARLFAVTDPLPGAKPTLTAHAATLTPAERPGDYAQAVMDLGATICTPRRPACGICPIAPACAARAQGIAGELPRKSPKPAKPVRLGLAYVVQRSDGAVLLEARPTRGLLGGMLGWPCSDWSDDPAPAPPLDATWHRLEAEVRHTFTHFHLRLRPMLARVETTAAPTRGGFVPLQDFDPTALPTLMRKVWTLAEADLAALP